MSRKLRSDFKRQFLILDCFKMDLLTKVKKRIRYKFFTCNLISLTLWKAKQLMTSAYSR